MALWIGRAMWEKSRGVSLIELRMFLGNVEDISLSARGFPAAMAWVVYVLRCRTGDLYTGCTTDLERRVREHASGRGGRFTRSRRPVTLVYKEESKSRSDALRREHVIKKMSRREKLALVSQTATAASE